MLDPFRLAFVLAIAALCGAGSANAAAANRLKAAKAPPTCKDLAYSVNDYGKEGPTKDAQALLDKHIEQWAKDEGITKYKVGQKNVNCELYLDVGLFDEYTCKATANVCWSK